MSRQDNLYKFTLQLDQKNPKILVDAEHAVAILFEMKKELEALMKPLKRRLDAHERYTKGYRKELALTLCHNEGYTEALKDIAFMCGWDFYFHNKSVNTDDCTIVRDEEAFRELQEGCEIECQHIRLAYRLNNVE